MRFFGWLRDPDPDDGPRRVAPRRAIATCEVIGVYGTAHTPQGDVMTGPPTRVVIDCERTTFEFDVPGDVRRVDEFTLHLGVHPFRSRAEHPPIARGDRITIVQEVEMSGLQAR